MPERSDRSETGDDDSTHDCALDLPRPGRGCAIGTGTRAGCLSLKRSRLDGNALFLQRQLGELVPVGVELLSHRLLVLAVLAGGFRRLLVAGALRDPLEQLVARD